MAKNKSAKTKPSKLRDVFVRSEVMDKLEIFQVWSEEKIAKKTKSKGARRTLEL